MAEPYYPGKYLSDITRKCRRMTVSEMLDNLEEVRKQHRMGFGHYLFDSRHRSEEEWSIPGALDYEVVHCEESIDVMFKTRPFEKEELTVTVEAGRLDVEAVHEEPDPRTRETRRVQVRKQLPVPFEFDLDEVNATFSEGVLVVHIPKPAKPRRRVEIE